MATTTRYSRSLFLCLLLAALVPRSCLSNKHKAWAGHTTPGSTTPTTFTPYYVPQGAKGYDSASPLLLYSGKWTDTFSQDYVLHSIRITSEHKASCTFSFLGTGVEWFGNLGHKHGTADVFMDGKLLKTVNCWSEVDRKQQRLFWTFDLPYGFHTMKIVNNAKRPGSRHHHHTKISIDALVVTRGSAPEELAAQSEQTLPAPDFPGLPPLLLNSQMPSLPTPQWSLVQKGTTGVHAMQLAIISDTHALIVDKVEHNPLTISGHPAWAALYNLETHSVRPISMQSNSFCAGGTFLCNGTLVNVGGNPVVADDTSSADFGDVDGLQAIRLFESCDSDSAEDCGMYEDHSQIRMASPRWYSTAVRLNDGSAMIIGGSKKGGWINNATVNNPTFEFFPPKNLHGCNGLPIDLPFLVDTLNSNLFPIAFSLPDGKIFMAANRDAMIYDWKTNTERRLPQIPNGVRVTYPMTGLGLLLPLSPDNNFEPEIMLCGGSTVDDTKPGYEISSQDPASNQCSRMVLTDAGISAGWQVEQMPQARTMLDAVLLPTGDILIVNGAQTGMSGYGNVLNQVGTSNADNPAYAPVLYNPRAPAGQRFSSEGMPKSDIPRLYHSVATLTPAGDVMVAGSNPNLDRSEVKYGTEYRVEWIGPPYMSMERPVMTSKVTNLLFGTPVDVSVKLAHDSPGTIEVVLMDLGYVTHGVHANSRMVHLPATHNPDQGTMTFSGPPSGDIYPPGPGWIYLVVDGVPSKGMKVMVGNGEGPPVDSGALESLLKNSAVDQYEESKQEEKDGSE